MHKLSPDAPEFFPSWMKISPFPTSADCIIEKGCHVPLCPFFENGYCEMGDECELTHGVVCDMCNMPRLHPYDEQHNLRHKMECLAAHEVAMEEAFGEARSADKVCGICMENIRERNARFGILEACFHCFCLRCIRRWRKNENNRMAKKTVRSCPLCRTHSHFVVPAKYWVEDAEEKKELIAKYLANTKQKQCKYVKNGTVEDCPFGNKCFYKHEVNGIIVPGRSPRALHRHDNRSASDLSLVDDILFVSDFELEEYITSWMEDMEDMISNTSGR